MKASSGANETVIYQTCGAVATLILNRPDRLNAFNREMRLEIYQAIQRAIADDVIRAVVLTGSGRSFSAGADLTEPPAEPLLAQIAIDEEYKPALVAIANSPKPFISAINGAAAGIGAAYALVCDLAIMAEDAYLYQAFAAIGLIPDGGLSWLLAHQLGLKKAYETIVSGDRLTASACRDLDLVNRVVATDRLLYEAQEWAAQLAEKAPLALRYSKESLRRAVDLSYADTIGYEAKLQNITLASRDCAEGLRAFSEKRLPKFSGI